MTLGIFSRSRIGEATAGRGLGFDMPAVYDDPFRPSEEVKLILEVRCASKWEVRRRTSSLSQRCALTPEMHHLVVAAEAQSMMQTRVLVNTSRGPMVDGAALEDAVRAGTIPAELAGELAPSITAPDLPT